MKRFAAVEGLRAWLAWAVLFDHLAYWSDSRGPFSQILRHVGSPAVMVFIIVSGFVITHLIVENREPYRVYLTRRFFRLFPLFVVASVAGWFAYQLQMRLPDPDFDPVHMVWLHRIVDSTDQYFWQHVIAHATMLFGAVPYQWLPESDHAFNMFAWSISLEWQFYLIAPLVIALVVRRPMLAPVLAGLFFVAQILVRHVMPYQQPALLLTVSGFFAVGIASRLCYPMLRLFVSMLEQRLRYIPLACIIVFYAVTRQHALAVWAIVYLGLIAPPSRLYQIMLESPITIYLGSRSYSTYLGHFAILILAQHIGTRMLGHVPSFPVLALMVVPTTLLVSELLYRYIEVPGIRLGSKLCKRLQPRPQILLRVA